MPITDTKQSHPAYDPQDSELPSDLPEKEQHEISKPETPSPKNAANAATLDIKYRGPILFAVMVSYGIFAYENTLSANLRPRLVVDFGEIDKLPLLTVAYSLGGTTMVLIWGKLYGGFNIKVLFCTAVLFFSAGTVICGSAPDMNALISGRVLAGIGGMGVNMGTMTYIALTTSVSERPLYMALVALAFSTGSVLGPILSGTFADSSAGWRWSFYLCAFIQGALSPVYFFLLPSVDLGAKTGSVMSRILGLDLIGMFLWTSTVACFEIFICYGGSVWTWNSHGTIALIVLAAVSVVAFAVQQSLWTSKPVRIFPVHAVKNLEYCALFASTTAGLGAIFIVIFFLPLFFQFVHADSALAAGVKLLPAIITMTASSLISGAIMGKYSLYIPWYAIGSVMVIVGGVLLHFVGLNSSGSYMMGASVLVTVGAGLFAQLAFTIVQAKADKQDVPAATAFIGLAQVGGINVSLAIANAIFLNQAAAKLSAAFPAAARRDIINAISGTASSFFDHLDPDEKRIAVLQIVDALREVFSCVVTAGGVVSLLCCALKPTKLRGDVNGRITQLEDIEKVEAASGKSTT